LIVRKNSCVLKISKAVLLNPLEVISQSEPGAPTKCYRMIVVGLLPYVKKRQRNTRHEMSGREGAQLAIKKQLIEAG